MFALVLAFNAFFAYIYLGMTSGIIVPSFHTFQAHEEGEMEVNRQQTGQGPVSHCAPS